MVDQVIMRAHPVLSALLLGLGAALAGMGLGSMAQAQTAQKTHAEVVALVKVESFEASITSLRGQYAQMVRMSGKVLKIAADTEMSSERFVLYAPLNRLWLIDATDSVVEHAYIEVKPKPFDHLVLHWMQWRDVDISDVLPAVALIPAFSVESTTPHPLALAYDALLSKPLARAFEPLPAGAYFSAGGHVFDADGAQIAEWDSYGAEIAMRLIPVEASADPAAADPQWQWLAVADLAAPLNPKQGDQ